MGGILEEIKAQLDRIEVRLAKCETPTGYVDQRNSPLGPRVHCTVVRRLIENGDERAYIRNRRFYLSSDALRETMLEDMRNAQGPANTQTAEDDAFYADLLKEVGV